MTDEQIEKAAEEYATTTTESCLKPYPETIRRQIYPEYDTNDLANAFAAGARFTLSHQWISVDERLPEDDKLVLAHFSDTDPELCYATAYYINGTWATPDDWYYGYKIDFWMPIPAIPPLNHPKE